MANVTITGLSPATALTGTEVLAIDQSGSTVKTTVQDVAGLALGTLDIIADGSIGGPLAFGFSLESIVPENTIGEVTIPVISTPSIYISGNSSYNGSAFTAENLTFPTVINVSGFQIINTVTLKVLSAPLLERCANGIAFSSNVALTTLNFPSLVFSSGLEFGNTPLLTTYNFPLLENGGQLNIQYSGSGLTGFRQSMFPALRKASFNMGYNYIPSFEIDFPLLTDLTGGINGSSNQVNLNNINLPNLVNIYNYVSFYNCTVLDVVRLGTVGVTKKWGYSPNNNASINFSYCSLDQESVDNILLVLASLDGTNGTTLSQNGYVELNNGSNSAPSSVGYDAINILLGRGFYVAVNG
jgi:hypothetical protein